MVGIRKTVTQLWSEDFQGRVHLEQPFMFLSIILKWILKKGGLVWTRSVSVEV
jgi:hypothetical protein